MTSSIPIHAFPECEEIWTQLDLEIQVALLEFGSRNWDTPETKLDDVVPAGHLVQLSNEGVLIEQDGEWQYTLPQMLFYIQSIYLIDAFDLHSRPPEEVLRELIELLFTFTERSIDRSRRHRILTSFILAQLVNNHGRVDVPEFIVSQAVSNDLFWQFYEVVCNTLPILNLDLESHIDLFEQIIDRTAGDAAGGSIYPAVGYLGFFHPTVGLELINLLMHIEDWETVGLLARLMTGVANSSQDHFDSVISTCENWLNSDNERLCRAAIYCSEELILRDMLNPDWLLLRVDTLIRQPATDIRQALTSAISAIGANYQERAEESLRFLSQLKGQESEGEVSYGIASALAYRNNVALEYIVSVLSLLVDVATTNKGTIKGINWLLLPIAPLAPGKVWDFLQRWILARGYEGGSVVEHDVFLSTIQNLYRINTNMTVSTLTRWFSSPDQRLVESARAILRELNIRGFAPEEIASMPPEQVQYMTEKLLVGRFEGTHLMRLLHSILKSTDEIEKLRDYFSQVLRYVVWNYPGSAKEFFVQAINKAETTVSAILQQAQRELEKYQEQRRDIVVPELAPYKRRVERFVEFQAKRMRAVQEATFNDDRFPLQKLLSRVEIGRGDRTFHMNVFHPDPMQRRTFTAPRGFGVFSESIELPRGEVIDPEGEVEARFRRLSYTLEDFLEDE